jgi:hypothetical protein
MQYVAFYISLARHKNLRARALGTRVKNITEQAQGGEGGFLKQQGWDKGRREKSNPKFENHSDGVRDGYSRFFDGIRGLRRWMVVIEIPEDFIPPEVEDGLHVEERG